MFDFFKAMHDVPRQEIIALLRDKGELNVSDIVKYVKISQPTVSHHLKILCEAKIISSRKEGKNVYYALCGKYVEGCCMNFLSWIGGKGEKNKR
jgi:DNA-binding transcriptional ArsR family regulator